MANEADEASLAKANKSLADGSIAAIVKYLGKLLTLLPFSLTKYSAIFVEVKGYFGISGVFRLDNQLGGADKVVGVADTANELNKLDGADEADVIVRLSQSTRPFVFVVCSPSESRINFESTTWLKAGLKAVLWPKARPKAMLWPKAGPKAMLWPKAGPKAML